MTQSREHFVYWMFDGTGQCLYIGCTKAPEKRWKYHRWNLPDMVALVAYKRMAGPYLYEVARRIEREQQHLLRPQFDGNINPDRPLQRPCIKATSPGWHSVAEISQRLDVPRRTLQRYIRTGQLKGHKVGDGPTSIYLVHESDLNAWLATRESMAS